MMTCKSEAVTYNEYHEIVAHLVEQECIKQGMFSGTIC